MSLRSIATDIIRRLQSNGFDAFWVGGCVRDFLLGRQPDDYDIATSARPEQIEALFPHTVPVGRQFGVLLVIEQNHTFQVATFRSEADYQDGRRPSHVSFSTAEADAKRRDFTVNGLFYDPVHAHLSDWVGGESDLKARILRTIGPPEDRFAEDHLRMLRAVRLAAQLQFTIAPDTFEALKANAHKITTTSAERLRDELVKLFRPPHAARALELLRQSNLLDLILPELTPTITCRQSPDYHPEGTVYQHLLLMLQHLPTNADPSLPWAVLLHDIAKPASATQNQQTGTVHFYGHEKLGADVADNVLRRLRFPKKQIDQIATAVRHHMQFKDVPNMRQSTLRRILLRPTFPLELELHRLDCLGSHRQLDVYDLLVAETKKLEQQPELKPPLLSGNDLKQLGLPPGPAMGALLAQIREKQLQGDLTNRQQAIAWARQKIEKAERAAGKGER